MIGSRLRVSQSVQPPTDAEEMRKIADFTARSLSGPFPTPFGSSVVGAKDGRLLTRQVNHGRQNLDPTAHAEVYTIRAACRKLRSLSLKGYILYSTCEPCPMCMAAILWSGLDRVVYGATISDAAKVFNQIYTPAKRLVQKSDLTCEVVGPVERARCAQLFQGFPKRPAPVPA
jgi:tRNA(Arg) A34 adenosine deaminase TadA